MRFWKVPGPNTLTIAIFLLGAILRFYGLGNRSFWLDETITANSVRLDTLTDVLDYALSRPDQMPTMMVVTWRLRGLGGVEWAVRLPSAMADSINILAVDLLAKSFDRPRVGVSFQYLNAGLQGEQRVYVSAHDVKGTWL